MTFRKLTLLALLPAATALFIACDSSSATGTGGTITADGAGNNNSKITADIAGYWIQTTGFSGEANRDTAIFVSDTIHVDQTTMHNSNGGTSIYARNGKIGNDGAYAMVDYEYVISGDTLYVESQDYFGTPDGIVNKSAAIQYVRKSKYTESALVDPSMIGSWREVTNPQSMFSADKDSLIITATTATYGNGYGVTVWGTTATLYVRAGEIGERTAGVDTKRLGYIVALDTMWINPYGDQMRGLGTPFTK